jgi:hypothetical protein
MISTLPLGCPLTPTAGSNYFRARAARLAQEVQQSRTCDLEDLHDTVHLVVILMNKTHHVNGGGGGG